jgi:hypothetical protein
MNRCLAASVCWLALVPALAAAPCRFRVCRPAPVIFRPPIFKPAVVKAVVVEKKVVVDAVTVFALPLVLTGYSYPAVPAVAGVATGNAYATAGAVGAAGGGGPVGPGPGGPGGPPGPSAADWRLLMETVRALNTDVQQIKAKLAIGPTGASGGAAAATRGAPAGATPPAAAGAAGTADALKRCTSCHDQGVAATKAKGNVFFADGKLTADYKARNRMVRAILGGTMPLGADGKPAPLSDAEAQAAIDVLTR